MDIAQECRTYWLIYILVCGIIILQVAISVWQQTLFGLFVAVMLTILMLAHISLLEHNDDEQWLHVVAMIGILSGLYSFVSYISILVA